MVAKLVQTVRDLLGIDRYIIYWDYPSRSIDGVRHRGSTENFRFIGHATKRQAIRIAREMNAYYGEGTHWIEPAPTGRSILEDRDNE